MSLTKVHTVYKVGNKRIPSVTTILGVLGGSKDALIHWAWKLGCEGQDYKAVRDGAASVGTLAHAMILAHLKKETVDTSDYSADFIDLAENSFLSYLQWEKQHEVQPIIVEKPLVSEQYFFGGTPDLYCKLDGMYTLVDFKTGKSIHKEHTYQVAAYGILIEENDPTFVADYRILRIGKDANDAWDEMVVSTKSIELKREIFKKCLEVYALLREDNRD